MQAKQGKALLSTQMVSALSSMHFQLRSRCVSVAKHHHTFAF
jgi:hypothetical protein